MQRTSLNRYPKLASSPRFKPYRAPCVAWLLAWALGALVVFARPASADAPKPANEAAVTLHGTTVFTLRSPAPDPNLVARAGQASRNLNAIAASKEPIEARTELHGSEVYVFVGKRVVVRLLEQDARAAGLPNAASYAAQVSTRVGDALRAERKRSAIANTVFSVSLVVFFGLLTLFLLRKVADLAMRAQTFLDEHPEKIPAVQLRSFEVLGPALVRSMLMVSLSIGRWVGLLGLVYAWLVVSLSMFESTRGYTLQLTGLVLSPISGLLARIAGSLPLLGVALVAVAATSVVVRLVSLFFSSVARQETRLAWLPPELAPAASFTLNAAVVVAALGFGAPIITGDASGPLAHLGSLALVFVGVAITPLLACVAIGIGVIFLRRLVVGARFAYGGELGRIQHIALTYVHMQSDDGHDVFVPHILSLMHPTRAEASEPAIAIEIEIAAQTDPRQVIDVLTRETRAAVEVLEIDGLRVRYRLTRLDSLDGARTRLWLEIANALREADIALASRRDGP